MTATGAQHASEPIGSQPLTWSRIASLAAIAFFGALPVLVLVLVFAQAWGGSIATDLHQFYDAAHAILDGRSPYPANGEPTTSWGGPYPYPPLPALLAIAVAPLPFDVAGVLVMLALVAAALGTLWILDVRDWRCYGVALMWPPVISAVQTGNLTLWLALACALAWRFRDRLLIPSAAIGVALAAKFFLWPVVIWLAATRRMLAALTACVVGVAVLVASWALIGFAGMADYPHMLGRLEDLVGDDSYTLYIVGLDLGLPSSIARAAWVAVGVALVLATVVLGRRGDERSAFVVALAASLALTPIVWLHYFALLIVVVALAQPRLGVLWFLPFGMLLTPGSGHPTPFQTAWTLALASLIVALALRSTLARRRALAPQPVPRPAAA